MNASLELELVLALKFSACWGKLKRCLRDYGITVYLINGEKKFYKCDLENESQTYLKQPKTTTLNITANGSYVHYTLSAYIQLYMNHETCDTYLSQQLLSLVSFPTTKSVFSYQ